MGFFHESGVFEPWRGVCDLSICGQWDTKRGRRSRNLPLPSVLSVVMLSVTLSAQPLQVVPHIHEIGSISTGNDVMHLMREMTAHRTHRMCAKVEAGHSSPSTA